MSVSVSKVEEKKKKTKNTHFGKGTRLKENRTLMVSFFQKEITVNKG